MMTGEVDAEELATTEAGMASETGTKLCPRHMAVSAARRVTTGRTAAEVLEAAACVDTDADAVDVDADADDEETAALTGLYT